MTRNTYKRILVVTDGLTTSDSTHQTAFNLAKQQDAEVFIVDTIKSPTSLSRWISPNASDVFEMVIADKKERLEHIAENFRSAGIDATTKVLLGKSSEVITKEAIDWNADLVVRYMKGVHSRSSGSFGNTARSLMRFCPAPLLLVGKNPIDQPRVLACIDTEHAEKENAAILTAATRLAKKKNLFGLYCWEMYGADMVEKRMSEEAFKESMEYTESIYRNSYDKFVEKHDLSAFVDGIRMENGQPFIVIPHFCREQEIDVVVMCSASLNHPLRRLVGSTVESVIDELPCSLLVVKPIGFVSPIRGSKSATVSV